MAKRILLIGTTRYLSTLRRHAEVWRVASGKRAKRHTGQAFELVVIDAASMYVSGERLCRDMRARFPQSTLVLLSAAAFDGNAGCHIRLAAPLTKIRLAGIASRLLRGDPLDVLRCGPLSPHRTARVLQAHGNSVELSPKLAAMIALFMSRPNETLSRKFIIEQVWKTAYMGDTRTLNVHIRLARRALEIDPTEPALLKTARGKGYRPELPAD